jgi:serine/threonine protein phosphatase PrpC
MLRIGHGSRQRILQGVQALRALIDPDQKARDIIHFSAVESIDFNNEANKMLITFEKNIKEGDIIVMCSDGIVESNGDFMHKELWLKYFMEEIQTDDVQQIADLIISEAIDNNYGKEKDDMTVIVAKVSK